MDVATGNIRLPALNTLNLMFGDDMQIGKYSQEKMMKALWNSKTLDDAIDIIVQYAEDVHNEQKEYDNISPYGGLDITVQPVDQIAFAQEDILRKIFPESQEELLTRISRTLKKRGHKLSGTEKFCEIYESVAGGLEAEIKNAWIVYENESNLEKMRKRKAQDSYEKCHQALQHEIDELEKSLSAVSCFMNLFQRKKRRLCKMHIEEMVTLRDSLRCGMNLKPMEKSGFISFFYPWEDVDFASPTTLYTKDDMDEAISHIHDYAQGFVKKNKEVYRKARILLSDYMQQKETEEEEHYAF